MKKHKIQQGAMIMSLDHLTRCDWVIIRGKRYIRGWVLGWPLRLAKIYIDGGHVYEGIRLTNAQYYPDITFIKAAERFPDELLKHCNCNGCSVLLACTKKPCFTAFMAWQNAPVS